MLLTLRSPSSTFEEDVADTEGSSTDRFAVSMNGKRVRRIITSNASEKTKDIDHVGASRSVFDDEEEESILGLNSGFLFAHKALRTSSTPESGRNSDDLEPQTSYDNDDDTIADDGGDIFDHFADLSTSGLTQTMKGSEMKQNVANNVPTFNNFSALSHFNAFQGQPLRAIQSVDSQLKPPSLIAVSSLPMLDTFNNNSNKNNNKNNINNTVSTFNNTITNSNIPVTTLPNSLVDRGNDSTDSEHSNGSDATSSGKQLMHAPAASRPHPSRPQRLSVAAPQRRPSPLVIGSADPFKHQHHRNSSSSGNLNLSDRANNFFVDSDGYNGTDEEGSDWFPSSPYGTDISPSSIPKPPTFLRVTSFSAFSSAPLYDEGSERRVAKLRKERRRREAGTEEFHRLRTMFTKNAITTLISKAVKAKRVVNVANKN